MLKKEEGRVPLNNDVMMKCLCGSCPVQTKSACSRPKIENMMKMRAGMSSIEKEEMGGMSMSLMQSPMGEMKPNKNEIAGPYCAIGVASCKDLDANKACICRQCQVYANFNLKEARPVEHFCFNNRAM